MLRNRFGEIMQNFCLADNSTFMDLINSVTQQHFLLKPVLLQYSAEHMVTYESRPKDNMHG